MRNKRSLFVVAFLTIVVFVGMGLGVQAAEKRLIIATASTGGTWYPLGGGVANLGQTVGGLGREHSKCR
jgi:TRAP-type uncharacterized transport system substrate-binding protein